MCIAEDDSLLFVSIPDEGKVIKIQHTSKIWDNYNVYVGNEVEVLYRAESVNHV
jgi:hypothetical protein